jgi:hypothetical protein
LAAELTLTANWVPEIQQKDIDILFGLDRIDKGNDDVRSSEARNILEATTA